MYQAAMEDAWRQKFRISVAEQQHCGLAHTMVGRKIIEKWNLPSTLVTTTGRHHNVTQSCDHFELVALVSASDALTRATKIGFVGDPLPPTLPPEVAAWLAVDATMLKEVQEELRARVADAREFLQMATGG